MKKTNHHWPKTRCPSSPNNPNPNTCSNQSKTLCNPNWTHCPSSLSQSSPPIPRPTNIEPLTKSKAHQMMSQSTEAFTQKGETQESVSSVPHPIRTTIDLSANGMTKAQSSPLSGTVELLNRFPKFKKPFMIRMNQLSSVKRDTFLLKISKTISLASNKRKIPKPGWL